MTVSASAISAALHWLWEMTELPERATPRDLVQAAHRNLWHVPPTDSDVVKLGEVEDTLKAAGVLS